MSIVLGTPVRESDVTAAINHETPQQQNSHHTNNSKTPALLDELTASAQKALKPQNVNTVGTPSGSAAKAPKNQQQQQQSKRLSASPPPFIPAHLQHQQMMNNNNSQHGFSPINNNNNNSNWNNNNNNYNQNQNQNNNNNNNNNTMLQQMMMMLMMMNNNGNNSNNMMMQMLMQQLMSNNGAALAQHQPDNLSDCLCPVCQYYRTTMFLNNSNSSNNNNNNNNLQQMQMMMQMMQMMNAAAASNNNNQSNQNNNNNNGVTPAKSPSASNSNNYNNRVLNNSISPAQGQTGNNRQHHNSYQRGTPASVSPSPANPQQQQQFNNHQINSTFNNNNNYNNNTDGGKALFPAYNNNNNHNASSSHSPSGNNNNNNNMMMMQQQMLMMQMMQQQHQGASPQQQSQQSPSQYHHHQNAPAALSSSSPSPSPVMTGRDAVIQFNASLGRVAEVAVTPQGRSMIQSALRTQQPEIVAACLTELVAGIDSIAADANGCHVLRSLIEVLSEQQADALAAALPESVVLELATHALSTRRILETLFERHHGHSANHLQPIVDIVSSKAVYLSQTQQGCLTLNKVFDRGTDAQKHAIVEPLLPQFASLAMDKYGNYVVQNVLANSNPVTRAHYVLQGLTGHFVELAKNKFSSNAVENVVRHCTQPVRAAIVKELFASEDTLENVAEDSFGNFVLQTVVSNTTDAAEFKMIEAMVRAILPRTPFAKRLEQRLANAQQIVKSLSEGGINNGNKISAKN